MDEISLWPYFSVLLRHRRLLFRIPVAIALVTAGFVLVQPRQFSAAATFLPQEPSTPQSGLSVLATQFGIGAIKSGASSPEFYASLLQSKEVLRDVLLTERGGSAILNRSVRWTGELPGRSFVHCHWSSSYVPSSPS